VFPRNAQGFGGEGTHHKVDNNWRLADGHRLVLDNRQDVRDGLPEGSVSVLALTCGCTPIRPASITAYGVRASPGVATGLVVMSSPRGANTARSTLAIAYGTLSADQKPRSVSGDNTPPSTRNPMPRGAASSSNRPAQRTPALHRHRARICPSSIEATIKIKNAIKKIVWPRSRFRER
jgi:hypothetical protein